MKPLFGLQAKFLALVAISLALVAAALGVLLLSWIGYRLSMPILIERMSA